MLSILLVLVCFCFCYCCCVVVVVVVVVVVGGGGGGAAAAVAAVATAVKTAIYGFVLTEMSYPIYCNLANIILVLFPTVVSTVLHIVYYVEGKDYKYFKGGFTTETYGSFKNNANYGWDAFQIEAPSEIRKSSILEDYSKEILAPAIVDFIGCFFQDI